LPGHVCHSRPRVEHPPPPAFAAAMKLLAAAAVGAFAPVVRALATASPVQKVITLLTDLEAKVIKEGEAAHQTFAEFTEWCEDRHRNLGFEIKTGEGKVADLKATIEKATSEISSLQTEIEDTSASISSNEADLKAATQIREQETADFAAEEKELMEIVDLLTRAIGILEREARKGAGAAMLQFNQADGVVGALKAMVEASMLGSQDAQKLTALVQDAQQEGDESDDAQAPAAAAYTSHSAGIIDTLQSLLDKAEEQLDASRKKEVSSKHNFEMLKQSLEDEVKYANADMDKAKKNLASQGELKAGAEGDLKMTTKELETDQETQGTLKQDCMERSQDYESEAKSREEELKALAEAKRVLKEMTAGAESITYAQTSLLQLRSEAGSALRTTADLANFEAVRAVRNLARRMHSEALAQLARRMASVMRAGAASGNDPFAKVKQLITDMIATLERDAQVDASHKAYCDKEMQETSQKKIEKTAEVDKLSTQIDSMSAKAVQLKQQVAATQAAIADLIKAQAEATKIRNEERQEFQQNKPEMEGGLEGVKMALKMLREYYAQEGKAHAAAEGAGSSIIGLLEVVESDFTKLLAEMTVEETQAQSEYETNTRAFEIEKASKETSVTHMTKQAAQLDKSVAEASSDREGVQTELSAILDYSAKLDEMCIAKPETFSERKARREAEIAGLKEALQILDGETVLLQRQHRRAHLRGSAALEPAM